MNGTPHEPVHGAPRRVAITGMGCLTAAGHDVGQFRESLFAGRSGITELTDIPPGKLRFSQVAAVRDFRPEDWISSAQKPLADRSAQFAIASARQAVEQSRLTSAYPGESVAVILGCSTNGRTSEEEEIRKLYLFDSRVHPLTVPRSMASSGTSLVCIEHRLTGPAYTLSTACASGTHAIGQAFHLVRSGSVQAALAGGHEAPLTYAFLRAWDSLRVVSPTRCRPFAADRDGMTLGEGGAVVALEAMDAALERGAEILGEVVGFGMSSDGHHMTHPEPAGPAAAMQRALHDGGLPADAVDYVNAHGTATEVNDRIEAIALHRVFGERTKGLSLGSTKGLHGHAMGASGAIELVATVLALRAQVLPATVGTTEVDARLALPGVLLGNGRKQAAVALSNSFAFGGLNAVLAVRAAPASS